MLKEKHQSMTDFLLTAFHSQSFILFFFIFLSSFATATTIARAFKNVLGQREREREFKQTFHCLRLTAKTKQKKKIKKKEENEIVEPI